MCGIAGLFEPDAQTTREDLDALVGRMIAPIRHRGPDDEGTWIDEAAGLGLGFRRLSILDLSAAGHQPMVSADGGTVMVFNGEIYNHHELRDALAADGVRFRGHSDSEALLESIARHGVDAVLRRTVGMFALAVWDRKTKTLTLARDRLGIKPLYYGWVGGRFVFGSEMKSLTAVPGAPTGIDRRVLSLYLMLKWVPGPYSIYEGIRKLPPGTWMTVPASAGRSDPEPVPYWSMSDVVEAGAQHPFKGTEDDAVEQLDRLLRDAVRCRMEADVPLGAFLSGGIDSSLVVSLMQSQSDRPVRTFTVGFEEPGFNEAEHARRIAEHWKTEHVEQTVTPREARDVIPLLPGLYDEPFADSSQIPTYLISQVARRHVTVSLSGDGGDEVFGGYRRYLYLTNLWNRIDRWPAGLRRPVGLVLGGVAPRSTAHSWQRRLRTLSTALAAPSGREVYSWLYRHWREPGEVVPGAAPASFLFTEPDRWNLGRPLLEEMMYVDTLTYLPDDILVKVDRASMGVSLEARVPLLDHRVVEFAWSLPAEWKLRDGRGKWILRRVLDRYVPRDLMERPKAGFSVPIAEWLRGPLREWAEDLLGDAALAEDGLFRPGPIRRKWREHLEGRQDWYTWLWPVIMFQAWNRARGRRS